MKNLLVTTIQFYKNNGLFGSCCNAILQLRGGQDSIRFLHTETENPVQKETCRIIDNILKDDQISEIHKKEFRNILEDPVFPN